MFMPDLLILISTTNLSINPEKSKRKYGIPSKRVKIIKTNFRYYINALKMKSLAINLFMNIYLMKMPLSDLCHPKRSFNKV